MITAIAGSGSQATITPQIFPLRSGETLNAIGQRELDTYNERFDGSFEAAKRVALQLFPVPELVNSQLFESNLRYHLGRMPGFMQAVLFTVFGALQHPLIFKAVMGSSHTLLQNLELAGRALLPSLVDNPDFLNSIGYKLAPVVPGNPMVIDFRKYSTFFEGGKLDPQFKTGNRFIVIGTGPGGMAAAHVLHERFPHAQILILEGGKYLSNEERRQLSTERSMAFHYDDGGLTLAIDFHRMTGTVVPISKNFSGTQGINSGTMEQFPFWSDNRRLQASRLWKFVDERRYKELATEIEEDHFVIETPWEIMGQTNAEFVRKAQALGFDARPTRGLSRGRCQGIGACFVVCPSGGKVTTAMAYLPEMLKSSNVAVATQTNVLGIVWGTNGTPIGVAVSTPKGEEIISLADGGKIILAAGTFGTPQILHQSGYHHPKLGERFTVHPAFEAMAFNPDRKVNAFRGVPQSGVMKSYEDNKYLGVGEGAFPSPGPFGMASDLNGQDLIDFLNLIPYIGIMGGMSVEGPDSGGSLSYRYGIRDLRYSLNSADRLLRKKLIIQVLRILAQTEQGKYFALRTNKHFHARGEFARLGFSPADQLGEFERFFLKENVDLAADIAFHPLGTDKDCVDNHGLLEGTNGVYVTDGSIIGELGVNPQESILVASTAIGQSIN